MKKLSFVIALVILTLLTAPVMLSLLTDIFLISIPDLRIIAPNIGQYVRPFGFIITGVLTIATIITLIIIDRKEDQGLANAVAADTTQRDWITAWAKKDATWRMITICLVGFVAGIAAATGTMYPYLCK